MKQSLINCSTESVHHKELVKTPAKEPKEPKTGSDKTKSPSKSPKKGNKNNSSIVDATDSDHSLDSKTAEAIEGVSEEQKNNNANVKSPAGSSQVEISSEITKTPPSLSESEPNKHVDGDVKVAECDKETSSAVPIMADCCSDTCEYL